MYAKCCIKLCQFRYIRICRLQQVNRDGRLLMTSSSKQLAMSTQIKIKSNILSISSHKQTHTWTPIAIISIRVEIGYSDDNLFAFSSVAGMYFPRVLKAH